MSLTSYRAAPPRDNSSTGKEYRGIEGWRVEWVTGLGENLWFASRHFRAATRRRRFLRPGSDLLFRVLRRSTIGAEGFHGRVRDGSGGAPSL